MCFLRRKNCLIRDVRGPRGTGPVRRSLTVFMPSKSVDDCTLRSDGELMTASATSFVCVDDDAVVRRFSMAKSRVWVNVGDENGD